MHSWPGDVIMLENLRFEPGETENDPAFAEALARLGEIYVNDAFGAAHRAHASVVGVAQRLPAVAGFLMEKEINFLSRLLENPERPYAAVLGGSKISDKLRVMENLMGLVDHLLLGGGMCFTLMRAQGLEIGKSLCEEDFLEEARRILNIGGLTTKEGKSALWELDEKLQSLGKDYSPGTTADLTASSIMIALLSGLKF